VPTVATGYTSNSALAGAVVLKETVIDYNQWAMNSTTCATATADFSITAAPRAIAAEH
jgi:hypothetical protein